MTLAVALEPSRTTAADLLRAGRVRQSIEMVRQLLATAPDNDDLLGLLGVALEMAGDVVEAEAAYRAALAAASSDAMALRHGSNLATLLQDLRREADLLVLLQRPWTFAISGGADASFVLPAENLGLVLGAHEMHRERIDLLDQVLAEDLQSPDVVRMLAISLCHVGRAGEAQALVDGQWQLLQHDPDRNGLAAYVAGQNGNQKASSDFRMRQILARPVHLAARPHPASVGVVVISPGVYGDALVANPFFQHFTPNFPSQLARVAADRFTFDSVFVDAGPGAVSLLPRDRPLVCLNNVTNAEILRTGQTLAQVRALEQAIGAPVLNGADKAARCTRQLNPETLGGIGNLILPKIRRYRNPPGQAAFLVRMIEAEFALPVLLRGTSEQEGQNLFRPTTRGELIDALQAVSGAEIYVIEYVGKPSLDTYFRKIRVAFVAGHPTIIRADYSPRWLTQGRKHPVEQKVLRDRPDIREIADDIIVHPEERLGRAAIETFQAIGRAMPLDIFGLDCNVDDEGRVVFFESNATMNLISNAPPEYDYPAVAGEDLLRRVDALLRNLALPQ